MTPTTYNPNLAPITASPDVLARAAPIPPINPPSTAMGFDQIGTQPLNVPTSSTSTADAAASSLMGVAEANHKVIEKQRAADASQTDIQSHIDKLLGKGTAQIKAETEAGIPQKQIAYNDITNEYNSTALAFRHQEEALMNQPGLTDDAKAQNVAEFKRQHSAQLADLAMRQAVALGDYNTAQNIVNHKIDLEYGDLKDIISYKMDFLKQNQDRLSKAENDKLQLSIQDDQRKYDAAKQNAKDIGDIQIEAAKGTAPDSVISAIGKATTREEAIRLAGPYLSSGTYTQATDVNGNPISFNSKTGQYSQTSGDNSGGSGGSSAVNNVTKILGVSDTTPASQVDPTKLFQALTKNEGGSPNGVLNNPGNIKYVGQAGATDSKVKATDGGTFASFPTPEAGLTAGAALVKKLQGGNTTLGDLVAKWTGQTNQYHPATSDADGSLQQLVNGDALLTDVVKSRGAKTQGQINKLINEAIALDPNFSVNRNKQQYAYKTQFNNPNGKEQLQINAINTGLGHLAEFKTASDALGNKIFLPYNQLVNYLKKNTGDPAVSNLNTVITALSGELAAVYKGGTAPTDQETEQWRNTILSSFSKSQNAGVSATTANLISNKVLTLGNSYKNIMGKYPDNPIINSDVLQQLQDAGVDTSGIVSKLQAQGYQTELNQNNTQTLLQPSQIPAGYYQASDGLLYKK